VNEKERTSLANGFFFLSCDFTEVAKSNRAGCSAGPCKKEGIKMAKGELKVGSWVDTGKFANYQWRHW